ncbi:hypothetical protein HNQ93_003722 [Hymenobacter luteus]|uniref:DUF4198 domain-containing protein n=2 Tax=Hymenobacter TaxID=89966 RepID=A0A7W9WEM5_9BACT|nr:MULTISPECIES: DUF4198 domain-containing protein [Hymenobacter]MBB4602955.1 hypothetical protein [Hymenobacter latericoloratus]MBB6060847.1 hypothetical protein [Hymenobacter luteus]
MSKPYTIYPLLLFAAISLLAGTALAREFWLEPARFFVPPGTAVHLRRLVGQNFRGETWAGKSSRVTHLVHLAPGAAPANLLPLATATDTLATTLTLRQPGTHLVALATTEAFTTLPAPDFTAYLQAEQLDYVLALRQQRGQQTQPGREAYRRCAKTLIQVGTPTPTDTARAWSRAVGLPLELVPEQNPATLPVGGSLTVRVLSNGRPVAGQPVRLWQRPATARALVSTLRSNQNGRVLFRISGPGEYLVSSVRMVAAPAGQAADWLSTWTTLTFSVAPQKRL